MRRNLGAILAALNVCSGLQAQSTTVEVVSLDVTTDRGTLPHVEPVVAVHPGDPDRIAIAAMAIESPHDDRFHDFWRVVVFVSSDGGASWTRRPLPVSPSGPALGDPSIAWVADGSLYLTALVLHPDRNARTWLWTSHDDGRSWTVAAVPAASTGSQDHPVLDVAGTAEAPALAVFATIAQEGISGTVRAASGERFIPAALYSPNQENNNLGAGLRLPDGGLLFTYFSMSGAMPTPLWAVRSHDGGRTWAQVQITDRHVPVGFPMLAIDRRSVRTSGRVYAVWVADEATGNVMLNSSDDGGRSWSTPVGVHHGRTQVLRARPAVHVNRHGVVAVSWTDGRNDAGGGGAWCWDVYAGISVDGGATFLPEVRLTSSVTCSQTPHNGAAGQRWRWGGDYAGIASDSLGRFYISWSDTRSGVYQPRVARLAVRH